MRALAVVGLIVLISLALAGFWALTFAAKPPRAIPPNRSPNPPDPSLVPDELYAAHLELDASECRKLAARTEDIYRRTVLLKRALALDAEAAALRQKIKDTWT